MRHPTFIALSSAMLLTGGLLGSPPASAAACPNGMVAVAGLSNVCEQIFTASGTFTVPDGAVYIEAFIVGGGGGGGGGVSNAGPISGGGGGGGGGYYDVSAAPNGANPSFSITVGSGGSGGSRGGFTAGGNGGDGQASSVNWGPTTSTAIGGAGGLGATIGVSVVNAGTGGSSGPVGDRRNGGSGAVNGGGGGGGGSGTVGSDGTVGGDGGAGGSGARPAASQILFGNLTTSYAAGGGGGASGSGTPSGGAGGTGGGGDGGTTGGGIAGSPNTGSGGGGGGVSGNGGEAGGAGASGLVIMRVQFSGDPASTASGSQPVVVTLLLSHGDGDQCAPTSIAGLQGQWVDLPAADTCANSSRSSSATLLGWATQPDFPVTIAQRQIDNGWGAYEMFDLAGQLTGVFIPAGGATVLSNDNVLHAIWSN